MESAKRKHAADALRSPRSAVATDWSDITHRELVSRIVASPTFARSERLSTLLTYVCDMTLKGREGELNEQRIGHAVFGRSPDYDSSVDGIVRTQASRLRQRLDLYFGQEGAEEPVRLVIPKGGYIPLFVPRQAVEESQSSTLQPQPVSQTAPPPHPLEAPAPAAASKFQLLPWMLCILLAAVLATLLFRNHTRASAAAASGTILTHPLWCQIFVPGRPTLEVPGDSGLVLSHVFDERSIPLLEYLSGDYRTVSGNTSIRPLSLEMRELRAEISGRRYTSIVDLEAAVQLGQMAQAAHSSLQVRYTRDVRPNDLKNGNAILIGAFEANPWVELFERNMNFSLHNDYTARVFSVINRSPRGDEPKHWDSVRADPQRVVYGVVAFLPNLAANGNVLLIEGTSMAGTEAAWDFVSDDSELLPFLKGIRRPDGKIPYFELLLGTQNMSSSAVRTSIISWRTTN
jgi:hypothetical protein